jgi:hypothetical protein
VHKSGKIRAELTVSQERPSLEKADKRLEYVQRSYSRAIYRYRPKAYSGKMILLVHEETDTTDPTLGWKDFVSGGIEVCAVAGNHNTYIRDYVQNTAGRLREFLLTATSKTPGLLLFISQVIAAVCES